MKNFSSKRALLLSLLSMVICVSMLIGSTFAWFTDSATANVNTIQAGNLEVDLQVKNANGEWVSAENTTLDFVKAEGAPSGEKTLWEPGCTYQLPELRIVNKGNLALKYQLVITGATGDTMLLDVIKFTATVTPEEGKVVTSDNAYGETVVSDGELLAGKYATLNISAHMDETANNDYMKKSIRGIAIKVLATQLNHEFDSKGNDYDAAAEYPTLASAGSLEEVFGDADIDFGFGNDSTDAVILDGKGTTTVTDWTDAWVSSDTTIKGVTFKNGAVFSAKTDNVTVVLENCTFYACDQSKLKYTGNNSLTNSGAGMCLNLEKSSHSGVKFIVKNCTFIGENDNTLSAEGPKYEGDGTVKQMKKRGHAIAIDAICGGGTGTLDSVLIEGCVIDGVRGNAIQLYGETGNITIKDTKINSWAVNNKGIGYAIRGDFSADGSRTLTLENVYFGLDEVAGNTEFGHIKVGSFSGNTDGTEVKGTYSK